MFVQIVNVESAWMVLWLYYASLDRTSEPRVHKNGMLVSVTMLTLPCQC